MIEIGDTIRFRPTANLDKSAGFPETLGAKVEGTVVQINEAHRWFRVRYETPQGPQFECFPLPCDPEAKELGPDGKRYYVPRLYKTYKQSFDGGVRPMGQAYRGPTGF